MTTRKQIILAVASGCVNTRQVANYLNIPYSTVNNYFYPSSIFFGGQRFVNGNLLRWSPAKTNTLRLGPLAAIVRGPDGLVLDVAMVADMNDLAGSFIPKLDKERIKK